MRRGTVRIRISLRLLRAQEPDGRKVMKESREHEPERHAQHGVGDAQRHGAVQTVDAGAERTAMAVQQ